MEQIDSTINVYSVGGVGCDVGVQLLPGQPHHAPRIKPYFIDSSTANVKQFIDKISNSLYIFKDSEGKAHDGSGGVRSTNASDINNQVTINQILSKFPPSTTLNIVVHSSAGGTGSIAGPVLVRQLLKLNFPTIIMLVDNSQTHINIENTIKTIGSYEGICSVTNSPVAIHYSTTIDPKTNRSNNIKVVIESVCEMIIFASLMFNKNNLKIDGADYKNFLKFNNVIPEFPPMVVGITYHNGDVLDDVESEVTPVSAITLTSGNMDCGELPERIAYRKIGICSEKNIGDEEINQFPIHMILWANYFMSIVQRLKTRQATLSTHVNSLHRRQMVGHNNSDDGLVI